MIARILSWTYVSSDHSIGDKALRALYDSMAFVRVEQSQPGALPTWFFESLDSQQKRDCITAFRKTLLSRSWPEDVYAALLDIFVKLLQTRDMAVGLEPWQGRVDNPVLWCIKASQRAMCVYARSDWLYGVLPAALHCMT